MTHEAQEIADAIAYWLAYKSLTGLAGLLSEASMVVPLGEYLARKHRGEIVAEVAHPLFKNEEKGRPRQLDFVRKRPGGANGWLAVYESKFGRTSPQAIVDDICRLLCLSQSTTEKAAERYFILAGKAKDEKLLSWQVSTGKKAKISLDSLLPDGEIKSAEASETKISPLNQPAAIRKLFQSFIERYGAELPSRFGISRKGWSIAGEFGCGVWKVSAKQGSRLLSAEKFREGKV